MGRPQFRNSGWGSRAQMTVRVTTAFLGAYAAASGIAAIAARLLPIDRAEATVWAMILSFAIYAALILWTFHEQHLARAASMVWGVGVITGGVAWLLGPAA